MHISSWALSRTRFVSVSILVVMIATLVAGMFFLVYSTLHAAPVNLALNRPAFASSKYSTSYVAQYVNDGKLTTRWASAYSDPQWVYIDLGTSRKIERVVLKWEREFGKSYSIQVSDDAKIWKPIYRTTSGGGGTDNITLSGTGRYVRMYGTKRATRWGYSLYEFEVYGTPAPTATITATPNSIMKGQSTKVVWNSTSASSCTGTGFSTGSAVDGSVTTVPVVTTVYSLLCTGVSGTTSASTTVSVTIPRDVTPPIVSLATPLIGAIVSGTTTASGNASDDVGIVGVEFKIDGNTILRDEKITPYSFAWNSLLVSDGAHIIVAVARDAAGNRATSTPVTITVANAPTVALVATPESITEGQSTTLAWSSSKATSCTATGFATGGATSGTVTISPVATTTYSVSCTGVGGTTSASATVNVTLLPPVIATCVATPAAVYTGDTVTWAALATGGNGSYTYAWTGTDGITGTSNPLPVTYSLAGNKTAQVTIQSGIKNIVVSCSNTVAVSEPDRQAPSVSVTSPLDATTVAGIVMVTASASDNVGVAGVQFMIDGANVDVERLIAPYVAVLNTSSVSDGVHTIVAVARDVTGNTATSAPVTVIIDNLPPVTGACAAAPASVFVGQTVTWIVTASGGTGNYAYVWNGTDGLIGTTTSLMVTYAASGNKYAQVLVTSGTKTATVFCSNMITVSVPTGFGIADRIRVNTGGALINVHDTANGTPVGQQIDGALGKVMAGPVYANSLWWWNVDYDTAPDGWSAQDFLVSDMPTSGLLPSSPSDPEGL